MMDDDIEAELLLEQPQSLRIYLFQVHFLSHSQMEREARAKEKLAGNSRNSGHNLAPHLIPPLGLSMKRSGT